jgi:RND family efflux transporter MFP subunit
MKRIQHLSLLAFVLVTLAACGESKKESEALLNEKKEQLTKLKKDQETLITDITKLEEEIDKLDPAATKKVYKLVSVDTLGLADFSHFIELQGVVDADNISIVTPRGNPGQVREIFVQKGAYVKKGQLLLKLDDAIYRQNLIAGNESIKTLRSQLNLASELLKRQQNLWSQGIGTEVQLLTAKNNVATLESQIRSAEEQVKVIQEQQKTTNVYAEVNGIADEVNVRVGEFFQGFLGTQPQIRIVNTSTLKVVTNVPENYAARVRKGSKVLVKIPDLSRTYNSTITFLSASIDPSNRSFITEAKLPSDGQIKPKMIATVGILDYDAPNAISIPVNVVQSDESGKYVFVLESSPAGQIARRRVIVLGQVQNEKVEVKGGLTAGEKLISAGYQGLYDGQQVSIAPPLQ